MPIDVALLRADQGGDPEAVREAQRRRFKPDGLVDEVLEVDARWRARVTSKNQLQSELSALQRGPLAEKKKRREPCEAELQAADALKARLRAAEEELLALEAERTERLGRLGNLLDASVPVSQDEDGDGVVIGLDPLPGDVGLPCPLRSLQCPHPGRGALQHDELLWRIGGYEPERGQRVAGHRGYFLRDVGVMLNQALLSFATQFLRDRGYCLIQPPYFMKREVMASVAQLADFDEQLFKVVASTDAGDGAGDRYLIATSEQPLCAFHAKEVIEEDQLPLRYAGVSPCFRKEVGKMTKDIRGIFRVHQFEKVEQFCITRGDVQESSAMFQQMLKCAEDFHKALGIPYRVVRVVSGELNDAATMKCDLEGWFSGQAAYRELVSCSNCTDFQSRALDIRHRSGKDGQKKLPHVHMLNSTLTAAGRGMCCVLENYQTPEGVRVPEALVPFMGGVTFMPFVRPPRTAEGDARGARASGSSASGH